MASWHYTYAGLHVASELPLPEWDRYAVATASGTIDVWINCDPIGESVFEQGALISTDAQCHFVVPKVAAYQVCSGTTISIQPANGAGWREIRLFLLGTVWAALLYQRGSYPLHASVIQLGNSAVAFCGSSGAGKSTVAAWLLNRGYKLLSDDLCRCVVPAHGPALVWPSTPRLKLWDDTLAMLGQTSTELERDHYRYAKFHVPWHSGAEAGPVPLRALYMLTWADPGVVRLRGGSAVQRLVTDGTYRPELLQTAAQLFTQWQLCVQVASRTEIWQFSRPREGARLNEVMQMLSQGWETPRHYVDAML